MHCATIGVWPDVAMVNDCTGGVWAAASVTTFSVPAP